MHSNGVPQPMGDPSGSMLLSYSNPRVLAMLVPSVINIGRLHRPFAKKYGNDIAVDLIEH